MPTLKTKYSQLLKIRKQKVDSIENVLAILNRYKDSLEKEIVSITKDINMIEEPDSGRFLDFVSKKYSFESMINLKKNKKMMLAQKNKEIEIAKREYKKALMEYEKIKYLDDLAIQKKLDKIKKDESKMLDEISVLTYKRRNS